MFRRPAPLSEMHGLHDFDCGKDELDHYLAERALFNHREGYSRTYVIANKDQDVVGYYSICSGMIERASLPRQIGGHGAPPQVPVVLLARLAVDNRYQGLKLGADLLQHAFRTIVLFSGNIGVRAMLVHALDDDAVRFYRRYNFHQARGLERVLLRSIGDIAVSLAAAQSGE